MYNFSGKTVFATGGASGMALLLCEEFCKYGGQAVLADINLDAAEQKAAEIRARGGKAIGVFCDVRDYASIEAARDRAVEEFGSIDVLATLAGGCETRILSSKCTEGSHFTKVPIEVHEWGLDVNLKGQLFCAHAIMKEMEKQMSGLIITIGSITGEEGSPDAVAYSTAKSAEVNGLTKSLAQAGAPFNIRCVGVAPGPVLTRANMQNMKTLSGKAAEPIELVELMLFIASGKCDALNGTYILADGGRNIMRDKTHGDNGKYN